MQEDGKNLLALEVSPGRSTPYYYKADGVMEAYIRVGNESVIAPDYIVNELILKGTNQSFDTLTTEAVKKDYSFTLLEATYLERTGLRFEPSDYVSFGLADKNGVLTNAGKLMTDQHTVYNSRMFCTRWNGLEKGSIFDDALDDKEYEGNLIYLLKSGSEFIRNNSKVRFVKEAQYRVDKPDYAERAVTEALVNALIHRDYIVLGSEVHIDMFDDRVEITSPGGMFGGGSIQEYDIYSIRSMRRNPVIADLFHRMKYMERRGSGLRKIVSETEKLPGYTAAYKPEFSSTATDFRVVLKNVNYNLEGDLVSPPVTKIYDQVTHQDKSSGHPNSSFGFFFCTTKNPRNLLVFWFQRNLRNLFYKKIFESTTGMARPLKMTIPDNLTVAIKNILQFVLNKLRSRALGLISHCPASFHSRLYSHHLPIHPILYRKFQILHLAKQPDRRKRQSHRANQKCHNQQNCTILRGIGNQHSHAKQSNDRADQTKHQTGYVDQPRAEPDKKRQHQKDRCSYNHQQAFQNLHSSSSFQRSRCRLHRASASLTSSSVTPVSFGQFNLQISPVIIG